MKKIAILAVLVSAFNYCTPASMAASASSQDHGCCPAEDQKAPPAHGQSAHGCCVAERIAPAAPALAAFDSQAQLLLCLLPAPARLMIPRSRDLPLASSGAAGPPGALPSSQPERAPPSA
ncbi:MAG: hypothetical protein AAB320_06310 [Elusimicrobiota bacterium]